MPVKKNLVTMVRYLIGFILGVSTVGACGLEGQVLPFSNFGGIPTCASYKCAQENGQAFLTMLEGARRGDTVCHLQHEISDVGLHSFPVS